jgi:hypothetical protein
MGYYYLFFIVQFLFFVQFNKSIACGFPQVQNTKNWNISDLLKSVERPSVDRQIALVDELMHGNIPLNQLQMQIIILNGTILNRKVKVELSVTEDYLRLGDQGQSMVVPLTAYAAQFLASRWGFLLPTTKIVDEVWKQSGIRLTPSPTDWYKYNGEMQKASNYLIYETRIDDQIKDAELNGFSGLISGHRKDVVVTNRLDSRPLQVAIYGWHRTNGAPIQSMSLVHDYQYEDYSHGIRMVSQEAWVIDVQTGNRVKYFLADLLKDKNFQNILGETLTDERAARRCPEKFAKYFGLNSKNCPELVKKCF